MKNSKRYFIYSIFLLFLTNASCNKPAQEIPTGDDTFSCFIDGELFVPKANTGISPKPYFDGLSLYKLESSFRAYARDHEKFMVNFNIVNWELGVFSLSNSSGVSTDRSINHAMIRINDVWYLSKENSGTVTFLEAAIEGNTKGTFEFTLYNESNKNDIIHVTNGQFDD